jgi:hypothetical protein
VRATSNPFITVIGQMTGRQLLRRPGYDLDIERVLATVSQSRSMATRGGSISIGVGCAVGSNSLQH